MRLVEHDAMRKPGAAPHGAQRRKQRADVLDLRVMPLVRQIDDDAAIRVAKGAQQVARQRWWIRSPEHADPRQGFE
jgi:hypothetical protein